MHQNVCTVIRWITRCSVKCGLPTSYKMIPQLLKVPPFFNTAKHLTFYLICLTSCSSFIYSSSWNLFAFYCRFDCRIVVTKLMHWVNGIKDSSSANIHLHTEVSSLSLHIEHFLCYTLNISFDTLLARIWYVPWLIYQQRPLYSLWSIWPHS